MIIPNEYSLLNPFNIFGSIFNVNFICSLQIRECYLKLLLYDLIIKRLTDVYIKHFQFEKLIV